MEFVKGRKKEWEAGLKKNGDFYGSSVYRFAERWANIMEGRFAEGKTLEEVADETSHQANSESITGFQHGCAVALLTRCWKHGESLRK